MLEYARVCPNMVEYARARSSMLEHARVRASMFILLQYAGVALQCVAAIKKQQTMVFTTKTYNLYGI